jgi:threonyl-tRNA synthetase
MIHRALLGSMERFAGVLIEHYGGRFPLWLAPTQVIVLPVADRHNDYAAKVGETLRAAGIRARIDERTESVGRKIRDAELARSPYMLVVGDQEQESGKVAPRSHEQGELEAMTVAELIERLQQETGAG